MKKCLASLLSLFLITFIEAQGKFEYHIHIVATDGSSINKYYGSAEELNIDKNLNRFQIGQITNGKLMFQPNQQLHKAFLVEEFDTAGNRTHYVFQASDSKAAEQVSKIEKRPPNAIRLLIPTESKVATSSSEDMDIGQGVLLQLVTDGIITSIRNASFKLTNSFLVVNSHKQSKEILLKFRNYVESQRNEKLNEHFKLEYAVSE